MHVKLHFRLFAAVVLAFGLVLKGASVCAAQTNPEAFDGSFRLSTGELITGGYFVEGGVGRFLYMDTEGLRRGGLFEPESDYTLRSVFPPGTVEIEFIPGRTGGFDQIVWRERDGEPIRGERVHPHQTFDVAFSSEDGTRLAGRLLVPDCAGPHPVIISVHGSGPVNRYGGPYHTVFLKHGLAVLAYDKRGYTSDADAWREPDLADLAADAAAAVRFIAADPRVDATRIGLFGSSQAGWVIPPAALAAEEVDFLILRAGAALTSAETSLHEVRQELRTAGLRGLDLDYAMDLRRAVYALAMRGASVSAADTLVAPYLEEAWYRTAFGEGPISHVWSSRWWGWSQRNHATTPVPALERFPGPVLWFLAERDENVPLISTRAALERAFDKAPGNDHEVVVIDHARHSFLIPNPDAPPRFAAGFFDYMGTWLVKRGYSDSTCQDSSAASG